ncbi:MAG: tetratricopeptide repeat protein [Verrucomicrobiales bacterium]
MKWLLPLLAFSWMGLWWTPDQLGMRYFEQEKFEEAAEAFVDPMWKGASFYRAGKLQEAASAFGQLATAEAYYNKGNSLVMMGKYEEAIASYDRALELKPDWQNAIDNHDLAEARAKLLKSEGGEMGDQKIGADEIVFDKDSKDSDRGEDTVTDSEQAMDQEAFQAMWLRQVTTRPADFLKTKFAFQSQYEQEGESP